jgi:SAM-dependent methyltransferase
MNSIKGIYRSFFPNYIKELERLLVTGNYTTLLDVGCGHNSPIRYVKGLNGITKTGIDAYQPSIDTSKGNSIHDFYIKSDLIEYPRYNSATSFDVVLISDVIEHFEEHSALELISAYEALASKLIIIFTPNGFLPQGELMNNPWQVHRSGFESDFFKNRGYNLIGVGGLKYLHGAVYAPRIRPKLLGEIVTDLTVPLTRLIPSSAFSLLAYKHK